MALHVLQSSQPDEHLVALLEEMLAEAKRGELIAIAGTADYRGAEPQNFYSGTAEWWGMSARLIAYAVNELPYEDEDDDE